MLKFKKPFKKIIFLLQWTEECCKMCMAKIPALFHDRRAWFDFVVLAVVARATEMHPWLPPEPHLSLKQ
jgi:hypothetical protein